MLHVRSMTGCLQQGYPCEPGVGQAPHIVDISASQCIGGTRASVRPGCEWKRIVYSPAQILLASDVSFGGIGSIPRCKEFYPDTIRARLYHGPNHILGDESHRLARLFSPETENPEPDVLRKVRVVTPATGCCQPTFVPAVLTASPDGGYTVIFVPSNLVNVNPENGSR